MRVPEAHDFRVKVPSRCNRVPCLRIRSGRGTIICRSSGRLKVSVRSHSMEADKPIILRPEEASPPSKRYSRPQMAIAFGVAAVSDILVIWAEFAPPFQWALDLATAFVLFLILGRRWALLPGL